MRRYFRALALSPFSARCYRDVAQHWRGCGFAYLTFVTVLNIAVLFPHALSLQSSFNAEFDRRILPMLLQLPSFRIEHGNVHVFAPMPHSVTDPISGAELIVFDTTGQVETLDGRTAWVLVTGGALQFRSHSSGSPRELDLWFVNDFDGNPEPLVTWLKKWGRYLILFGFLEASAFSLLALAFIAAGATTLGLLLMEASSRIDLSLTATARLAAVATTPPQLLVIAFEAAGHPLPMIVGWPLTALMTIGYTGFGLWANLPPAPHHAPDQPAETGIVPEHDFPRESSVDVADGR